MKFHAHWRMALLCAVVVSGAARAETAKPAPTAPTPAAAPAPAQPAAAKPAAPVAAPAPAAQAPAAPAAQAPTAQSPAAQAPAAMPAAQAAAPTAPLSESKYLSVLYSEIARHTPEESPAGPGEVRASFIVGASGRVEKITIDKTSSPAHAEIVKRILSEVVTPPPPGGSMDVGQTFRFW
jgi:outer membrane biosynthesis protein TonB